MTAWKKCSPETPRRAKVRAAFRCTATAGCLILAAAGSIGCVPLQRYRSVVPRTGPAPVELLAERMDPWLLAEGLADRIVVEVDWVEGCEPAPLTLGGLEKLLVKYGPPGREVEIERSDTIARGEWDAVGEDPVEPLVSAHANPFREEGVEHRYILFAPGSARGLFGYSTSWWVERDGLMAEVRGVVVFRNPHERYDILWVSLDEIERMTLVHEFGHQLGLVADPRHARSDRQHVGHCTRLDCAMAHPTGRLWLRNIWRGVFDVWFTDYCPECQAEIRTAQEEWRTHRAADPDWESKVQAARERRAVEAKALDDLKSTLEAEDWAEALRKIERLLPEMPESRPLAWYRINALVWLDRVDDALAALADYPAAGESDWARAAWLPAQALIAAGRHAEALSLLDRVMRPAGAAPVLDDWTHEGTSVVVIQALVGTGRYGDAARLAIDVAERRSMTESRVNLKIRAGDLYRRSGDLVRAEAVLAPLHRSRRTRSQAVDAMFRLRSAQRRVDEACEVLEKAVAEPVPAEITEPSRLLTRANRLALLGRREEAEADLHRAEAFAERSGQPAAFLVLRAEVLAALGDPDAAAGLLRQFLPERTRLFVDLCGLEWTLAMRSREDLFGHCPLQLSSTSE